MMPTFKALKKSLRIDSTAFPEVRIALLADSASQFLKTAIEATALENRIRPVIFEAEYDQIDRSFLNADSELYDFNPQFVFVFYSDKKVTNRFYKSGMNDKVVYAESFASNLESLLEIFSKQSKAPVIVTNFPEKNDGVFGNFGNKVTHSLTYQTRKLNYLLNELAIKHSNLLINDIAAIVHNEGIRNVQIPSYYINADLIYDLDFLPAIAFNSISILQSLNGKSKKCLILDLDNTTWGGIIGDDGIENIRVGNLGIGKAFSELQLWAKQLKERGIILAVCSKNDEETAKEPFISHPEMVLKLDDISVFIANWENKAGNIKQIQEVLNIGMDSMVFIDDSKFERELVRQLLPDLVVPEMPEDPAEYLNFLQNLNLFEVNSFSAEDAERTKLYQEEFKRKSLQKTHLSEDDYLKNLGLKMTVSELTEYNLPRVAQLIQRSNQFNLRTQRYNVDELREFVREGKGVCYAYTLSDKFGDYGLISVVMVALNGNEALIDNWVMSCRVLNRGAENCITQHVASELALRGISILKGEYIPSAKNKIVLNLYRDLGFNQTSANQWALSTGNTAHLTHFIHSGEQLPA